MTVRVTQNMMISNLLSNLQTNYRAMDKTQQQLATGKKINRPSDNPVTAVRSMYYQTTLNEIDQYKRNVSDGSNWLQATDEGLDQVTQVIQRVRELTVQASNSNDQNSKNAIVAEISQLKDQLGQVANTELAGKYIFAGTDNKQPPYDATVTAPNNPFTNTNGQSINYQVGKGSSVPINITGVSIFNYNGGMFKLLDNVMSDIQSGNNPTNQLNNIDAQIDNVLTNRSELGARMNRMDLSSSRLDGLEQSATNILANEEDVDIPEAYTRFSEQQNVYRSALSVGARIIQPSLVDFLR
ncbi:flagellar hook-associated protein FlgL [Neobacillus massiliamazoniensis]|uniref:Flagellar hook-associated protein FlgL n=1 Tax=Neobacillus massiliamazoniensis TaxID=1499688 RepID=A0A0U1NS93_9BACI|nr:flagellar hook-associated protein FlgL [Neobacillus massiliamazoniensis]CRK80921.1 flagellar hook-associated protein FlgL [Neobacillus massiliamazoniensis]